jgi:hypothetical protein
VILKLVPNTNTQRANTPEHHRSPIGLAKNCYCEYPSRPAQWTSDAYASAIICHATFRLSLGAVPLKGSSMIVQRAAMPAAILLTLTMQVAAQDLPVLGQGNLSCGSWAERRLGDGIDSATMTAWVLGYVTAFNQYGADPKVDVSGGQNTEEINKWIDDYCKQNGSASLLNASAALLLKFRTPTTP